MAFYAGAIVREPAMQNPTIVVLTDRNDLDDQLFTTFSRCRDLLRQPPVQAETRADLRQKLTVTSGHVYFTTIQKFFPEERGDTYPTLSERRNIVVIADEAHRSQYDFVDGFARHMRDALPNASFVGFTGTPIELEDANTRAVFGDYISVYDIQRSVEDGATVPIHYESRLAKLVLDREEQPTIDPDFDEATEGEEIERKERLKTKWAQLEAVVGAENRVKQIAQDIVDHFEQRLEALDGKAMVVCMSRRICVHLYDELVRLRPGWHDADDAKGNIKVVMTGSASDPLEWQQHIRNKPRREALANRFRDADDPFRVVLVRDMWLTGFDAPSLHTMYVDKPMRGHGLMQAIARVNRVFKDKPGGLVVDYLGLGQRSAAGFGHLHRERRHRADRHQQGRGGGGDAGEARSLLRPVPRLRLVEMDYGHAGGTVGFGPGGPGAHPGPGKRQGPLLSQAVQRTCPKHSPWRCPTKRHSGYGTTWGSSSRCEPSFPGGLRREARPEEDLDLAVRQIVSRAVASEGVIDIFAAAGLEKPDISVLSEAVSVRSAGDATAQPGGGVAAEAAQRGAGYPPPHQPGTSPLLRRNAGADVAPLSEPGHRGGPGHRGAHPVGPGYARGRRQGRKAWVNRRRVGFLRCPGDQR